MYPAGVTGPAFIVITDEELPSVSATPSPRRGGRPRLPKTPTREYTRRAEAKRTGTGMLVPSAATAPDKVPEDVVTTHDDLAAVVVRRTLKQMAAGKLQPTLRDGLAAQQLLDRRAEKAADRSFMLNLALALAGGGQQVPQKLLPASVEGTDDVIEGEFTEENLAPAHLRSG